jgi:thymidine phosphorylase
VNAAEIIRRKRNGAALSGAEIEAFARGLVDGSWADSQAAALAMAICWRGMTARETADLTDAMTASGEVLDWSAAGLHGPVVDKHSTGGVGDKVSLVLAPLLAACGAVVPMISGRGLGHTGGTLDKLEALPGYGVQPHRAALLRCLQTAGCAIVGAGARLAPADARLYAIRDVTATVESLPLITASILSKKRAAGLQALVLDVKCGQGAFMVEPSDALALAHSLVDVARQSGLPTVAWVTDMNQVLGRTAGHALEVAESLDLLCQRGTADARLLALTMALGAQALLLAGLQPTLAAARSALQRALDSGQAAERFARMVAELGGPRDVLTDAQLPAAPVQRVVPALRAGFAARIDVRALGLAVLALGGGRTVPGGLIDPRVGLAAVLPLGAPVATGDALAWVHAADDAAADRAVAAVQAAYEFTDTAAAVPPLLVDLVGA